MNSHRKIGNDVTKTNNNGSWNYGNGKGKPSWTWNRKLSLVGIIPDQLLSLFSDERRIEELNAGSDGKTQRNPARGLNPGSFRFLVGRSDHGVTMPRQATACKFLPFTSYLKDSCLSSITVLKRLEEKYKNIYLLKLLSFWVEMGGRWKHHHWLSLPRLAKGWQR